MMVNIKNINSHTTSIANNIKAISKKSKRLRSKSLKFKDYNKEMSYPEEKEEFLTNQNTIPTQQGMQLGDYTILRS